MLVGAQISSLLTENTLSADAIPEALQFFELFATISSLTGQIIYFRVLFMLLQKQIQVPLALNKFTHAATLYPDPGMIYNG